jgi:hypothetical protein
MLLCTYLRASAFSHLQAAEEAAARAAEQEENQKRAWELEQMKLEAIMGQAGGGEGQGPSLLGLPGTFQAPSRYNLGVSMPAIRGGLRWGLSKGRERGGGGFLGHCMPELLGIYKVPDRWEQTCGPTAVLWRLSTSAFPEQLTVCGMCMSRWMDGFEANCLCTASCARDVFRRCTHTHTYTQTHTHTL